MGGLPGFRPLHAHTELVLHDSTSTQQYNPCLPVVVLGQQGPLTLEEANAFNQIACPL